MEAVEVKQVQPVLYDLRVQPGIAFGVGFGGSRVCESDGEDEDEWSPVFNCEVGGVVADDVHE